MKTTLIAGHGRSGTNWLLSILDQSTSTFCGSERNRIGPSLMAQLPDPSIDCDQYVGLENIWDWFITETKHRFGERDPVSRWKDFLYPGFKGELLRILRTKRRLRALASTLHEPLAGVEWPAPASLIKQRELDQALLVLKINQCPGLACWLLRTLPRESLIVHILRHPGGVINSWRRRFVNGREETIVKINNRNRLELILAMDSKVNSMTREKISRYLHEAKDDLVYSEALYWLYSNERIYECGARNGSDQPDLGESDFTIHDNYVHVNYEMLCQDTKPITELLYSRLGLVLDDDVMKRIDKASESSLELAEKWKTQLSRDDRLAVDRTLDGSLFAKMWA